MFKKFLSKLQAKKKAAGDQRIVNLANELKNEIINQGYKLKDEKGFGSIFIWLHSDGEIAIQNSQSGLDVKGKQEAIK